MTARTTDGCRVTPRALPSLGESEVHVWSVDVTAPAAEELTDDRILSPAERARAAQFRFAGDRARFVRRRSVLREILGGYLGVSPQAVAFSVNAFGKPSVIVPPGLGELSFNMSHSGAIALIAVARAGRIGIDVEQLRAVSEAEGIARRFFATAEAATLVALEGEQRVEGFFNAWTRKEAIVKALGSGLTIPLDSFEVSLRPGEAPAILRWEIPDAPAGSWWIRHLEPASGYVGALATDRELRLSQYLRWTDES